MVNVTKYGHLSYYMTPAKTGTKCIRQTKLSGYIKLKPLCLSLIILLFLSWGSYN